MTYDEKMEELRVESNAFKDTPDYRPYLRKDGIVFMVTYDIYTDPRYHEEDVKRWSIYYGKPKPDGLVRLAHVKWDGQLCFDTPLEAQRRLDAYAKEHGWKVDPKPERKA